MLGLRLLVNLDNTDIKTKNKSRNISGMGHRLWAIGRTERQKQRTRAHWQMGESQYAPCLLDLIQFFLRWTDFVKLVVFSDKAGVLCGRFLNDQDWESRVPLLSPNFVGPLGGSDAGGVQLLTRASSSMVIHDGFQSAGHNLGKIIHDHQSELRIFVNQIVEIRALDDQQLARSIGYD